MIAEAPLRETSAARNVVSNYTPEEVERITGVPPEQVFRVARQMAESRPGTVTNSQRTIQWREKVVEPVFEAKSDYEITYLFAQKFGFADKLFKNIGIRDGEPVAEDITREITRGQPHAPA